MNFPRAWWKPRNLSAPHPRADFTEYRLVVNGVLAPAARVICPRQVSHAYRDLRHFALPQYDQFYLMRRKKAFNTLAFRQAYDVFVCDRQFRVLALYESVAPGFISNHHEGAHFIFFATPRTINFFDLKVNDRLQAVRSALALI